MPPPRLRGLRARRWFATLPLTIVLVAMQIAALPAPTRAADVEWVPPVPGRVVASFHEPISRFGAGHRGVDFAAPAGAPVRAANDGTVTFSGDVAGSLHVVVSHRGGIRTSHSFLSRIDVQAGQSVRQGQVVGAAGGTGEGHGPGVLHFGVRIGDRYVDPMLLFRPTDLTEMVRLVPADERGAADRSESDDEAAELRDSFPEPSRGEHSSQCSGIVGDVASLIGLGDEVESVCEDLPGFVRRAWNTALEVMRGRVDPAFFGEIKKLLANLEGDGGLFSVIEDAAEGVAGAIEEVAEFAASTVGEAFKAIVKLGASLLERLASCPQPPSQANPPTSENLVMAVGGLGSSRRRRKDGTLGASFAFESDALGYLDGNVDFFTYDPHRETYTPEKTGEDLQGKARSLGKQIKDFAAAHPGQKLDLVGHSQGGVVIALFLQEVYRGHEAEYPAIENVITFASPLQGTPTANLQREANDHPGLAVPMAVASNFFPIGARSLDQLCEGSPTIEKLWRRPVPPGVRFLAIGGMEDPVVPSPSAEAGRGARSIVVSAGDGFVPDDHSAILHDDDAISAAQAHLQGREPAGCGFASGAAGELYANAVRAATAAIESTNPFKPIPQLEVVPSEQ